MVASKACKLEMNDRRAEQRNSLLRLLLTIRTPAGSSTRIFLLAASLILAGPSVAAFAVTLYSPPVGETGGTQVTCSILNTTGSQAGLVITAFSGNRALVPSSFLWLPHAAISSTQPCPAGGCASPYCKFETNLRARDVRASVCVSDSGGRVCLPAQ
jgi:hypothetical protein